MSAGARPPVWPTAAVWLALSIAALVFAGLAAQPGTYYDEAFLAQQAADFLEPDRTTVHPPGTESTWIAGRRLPLRNAAYLGSLKSQLLIPALALFGKSLGVVRLTTLCTALLGLLFAMLWARRLYGAPAAAGMGVLVASDPSFLFLGQYEWGPFTTLLLCRALGAWLVTEGWLRERSAWLGAGGLVLGLGVYARADFAVLLAGAALALVLASGASLLGEVRRRGAAALLFVLALALGASPMVAAFGDLLEAGAGVSGRGGLAYKAQVLWSTLDGSHFHRVIEKGGLFEALFDDAAPMGVLGFAAVAGTAWLVVRLFGRRTASDERAARVFLVVATIVIALATWLLPGAVRAHHHLNLLPLPHLLVVVAAVDLGGTTAVRRACAGVLLAAVVLSNLAVVSQTSALIAETGGRGRFSDALDRFAAELDAAPGAVAVSLDWGFHEPLLLLTRQSGLVEPIWTIPRHLERGRPWSMRGDARHVYLVHDHPYDLFALGPKLLAAARALDPERVEIREHRDRRGDAAFYSVRVPEPHVLVYTGEFELRFGS